MKSSVASMHVLSGNGQVSVKHERVHSIGTASGWQLSWRHLLSVDAGVGSTRSVENCRKASMLVDKASSAVFLPTVIDGIRR